MPVDPIDPAATIGHTSGTQVPVLEIDGEWRRESSEHAHWLDQIFPDQPLRPLAQRAKIDDIDRWISNSFLPSIFRGAIDGALDLESRFRAWRLAALVSAHTPLPEAIRNKWPELIKGAPFIQQMGSRMDLTESHVDMRARILAELVEHIGDGPYMGELDQPSMLDLAVFPQLVFGYLFGLEADLSASRHPVLRAWMRRVAEHLPPNPTLAADEMQIQELAPALS